MESVQTYSRPKVSRTPGLRRMYEVWLSAAPLQERRNPRELLEEEKRMANIKVTCPHCGEQTWVRENYNDPCERCGMIIIMHR